MVKVDMELMSNVKKELLYLGIIFIGGIIVFKILFFNEGIISIIRTVFSLLWLFVFPGFAVMYCWHEKLEFTERLVIGTVLGIAVIGIMSYYTALLGFHVKYHFILPAIIILVSAFFVLRKKANGSVK